MFGNDRNALRQQFIDAWQKYQQPGSNLSPLEQMIGQVIAQHPEYHGLFKQDEEALRRADFQAGDHANPFLHMGLHISLHEQLQTDRPTGIRDLYTQLAEKTGDRHTAEHLIIECLEKSLWEAQAKNAMPDENAYLACIRSRLRS